MTNEIEVGQPIEIFDYLRQFAANLPASLKNGEVVECHFSRFEIRNMILAFQAEMQRSQDSGVTEKCDIDETFPLTHRFAPGAYAREMKIPKDSWIIGKIHKHAHFNFITSGKVVVLTEEGPMVITAPYTFVSSTGTKRLVIALEETTWTTIHVTDETDLEKIESHVIAKSYDELKIIEHGTTSEKLL